MSTHPVGPNLSAVVYVCEQWQSNDVVPSSQLINSVCPLPAGPDPGDPKDLS